MRKIDESLITNTSGMPIKSGVMLHWQLAYQEILAALATVITGAQYDPTKVYILYGVNNSGSGLTYVFSAGAVFFNGEVYLVDAVSFTALGGQVAIGNIVITFYTDATADPVQFTDGSSNNVLQIRKAVLSAAATGTGTLPDYADWIFVNSPTLQTLIESAVGSSITVGFTQDQALFFTTGLASGSATLNWDFQNAIPGTVVRLKVVMGAGTTLTIATPGGSQIICEAGAPTASKTNIIYALYLGVNDQGNNEVSYKVISF